MSGSEKRPLAWLWSNWPLRLAWIAAVAIGLAFALLLPANSAPDEQAHLAYVAAFTQGHLPVIPSGAVSNLATGTTWQGQHPPLYYLLATPWYWLCGQQWTATMYALRVINVVLLLMCAIVIACAARDSYSASVSTSGADEVDAKQVGSLAGVLFLTQATALYIASGVTNEVLAVLFSTLCFWATVQAAQQQWSGRWLLLAVLFGGLGLLTKLTAVTGVIAAMAFAVFWPQVDKQSRWKAAIILLVGSILLWIPWALVMKTTHGVWIPSPINRPAVQSWGEVLLYPAETLMLVGVCLGEFGVGLLVPYWLMATMPATYYPALTTGLVLLALIFWRTRRVEWRWLRWSLAGILTILVGQVIFRDLDAGLFLARYTPAFSALLAVVVAQNVVTLKPAARRAATLAWFSIGLVTAAYIFWFFAQSGSSASWRL